MARHHHAGAMTGLALLFPITLSTMAIVLLAPILPALLDQFSDIPRHEYLVPMVLTVPALCVALFSPIAGIMGDYFGRRRLLLVSFLIYAVVGVAPVYLDGLGPIIASRVAVGIAEAMIMVLSTTMIGDYFDGPARDRWLAAQTAMASISALVFFNVGGFLGTFGWRAPFWVYASALLMFALVARFTWEPSERDASDEADAAPHHASWAGFPWLRMAGIMLVTVFGSVLFYTVQIQSPVGLTELGITDPARTGFLTSLASIGVPIGTLIYSRAGSRLGVRSLLSIEFMLLATGFLLMSRSGSPPGFLVGCFINQLGAGMLLPTLLVWAISGLAFEIRSRGAGLWTGAFSVGQFISPIAVTAAASVVGGLLGAFGVLAAAALIASFVALLSRPRLRMAASHG
ncbi:MFS transporter [Novosphingobium flavum]|uniref:MFS transporter n=1 Tax=Novosphingobium flavum TaxID=1778672 RepID=A0A7X1KKW3_9SPHN|nr:MFS transporter [Novosphingobium flavum]MBC2664902.1 MFS transporter [Novosphingobium flavum]